MAKNPSTCKESTVPATRGEPGKQNNHSLGGGKKKVRKGVNKYSRFRTARAGALH